MIVPQLMESTSLEAVKYFDMMASLLAKNIAFDEFYNANKNDPMFPFSKSLTSYDDVIADIEHFTGPLEKEASLLFIHGPDSQAPSISILAYAVAKQMKANKLLGASFFFPTPGFLEFPLIGPSTLILTIAYQLGIKFPILQPYIVQGAISSSASSLSRQLEELIAKPALVLRNMNIAQKQIIVINGLDYCPESSQSHLRSVVQLHLRSAIESLHRCISNNDLPLAVLLFGGDSSKDALKKDPSSAEIDLYFVTGEGKGPGPQFKQVFSSLTPLAGDVWSLLSHFTIYGENLRTPSLQLPIASLIMQLLELGPDDLSACLLTLQPLFPLPCQSLDTLWQTQAELRLIWSPWLTKFLKNYRRTKIHRSTGSKIDILLLKLCIKIITNNLKEHSHMGVYCNAVGLIYAVRMCARHWRFAEREDRVGTKPPAYFIDGLFNILLTKADNLPTNLKNCVFFSSNFNIQSRYPFLEAFPSTEADFIYEKLFDNNFCDPSYKTVFRLWREVRKCASPEGISLIIALLLLPESIFGVPLQFLNVSEITTKRLLEPFTEFIRQEKSASTSDIIITLAPFTGDPRIQEMYKLNDLQARLWLNHFLENKRSFDLTSWNDYQLYYSLLVYLWNHLEKMPRLLDISQAADHISKIYSV